MSEGLCWCASDNKCPHGISHKIPEQWDTMEQVIDEVLQQFDRRSIKKFLKRDADGNVKPSISEHMKETHSGAISNNKSGGGTGHTKPSTATVESSSSTKHNKSNTGGNSTRLAQTAPTSLYADETPLKKHASATEADSTSRSTRRPTGGVEGSQSPSRATAPAGSSHEEDPLNGTFRNDLLTSTLPRLPPRALTAQKPTRGSGGGNGKEELPAGLPTPQQAWGSPTAKGRKSSASDKRSDSPTTRAAAPPGGSGAVAVSGSDTEFQANSWALDSNKPEKQLRMPTESAISVGIMRIAETLSRNLLPWQATLCPKAVETLYDVRASMTQNKHNTFILQMKEKLENKVMSFLKKKEEEVELWVEKERKSWATFMKSDEADLSEFIKLDLDRISNRAINHDNAYRLRELGMATDLDDHERDSTRDQLVNFRRIVRSDGARPSNAHTAMGPEHATATAEAAIAADPLSNRNKAKSGEVRVLQDAIAKAQSVAHKKMTKAQRDLIRKREEAHDWLCSLADNSVTAAESEKVLRHQYEQLDAEKAHALEKLHSAINAYKEQHNTIQEAIVVFAGRIHQHATDYMQREQLVLRAFVQYLLAIVSGEIKPHTGEQKKKSFAWETKALVDRGNRKGQLMQENFNVVVGPMDKLIQEFKDRMKVQLDHITMKLQAVMNGRENDINSRKGSIHRKLARHVNKACNARRQRLKDSTAIRRDEFEMEERCIVAVEGLASDLRSAVDQMWVKEHLKERRMYEASAGRMERLEKSALIIWNKHAHLAVGQKEEYEEWLEQYKKDRDFKMSERRAKIEREWRMWRNDFAIESRKLAIGVRPPIRALIQDSFAYDVTVSVEKNVEDVRAHADYVLNNILSTVDSLHQTVDSYLTIETKRTQEFADLRYQQLLQEWRENLFRLNDAVNRRVGGLKDMEADLEETIRLTILQHEVENSVFEQQSCARVENFWLEWRGKMFAVSKALKDDQQDYQIAKNSGKVKRRSNKADRALDDLQTIANDKHGKAQAPVRPGTTTAAAATEESKVVATQDNDDDDDGDDNMSQEGAFAKDAPDTSVSDTLRLKRILDELRPEITRDFMHKLTRGLERVRRDLGEGRKRLVPPFAITKALLINCDIFWDRAKLAERCVGRIASKGMLLFKDGLPLHARGLFCIATTMAILAEVPLRDHNTRVDCDDLFHLLQQVRRFFVTGLLAVSMQIGEFGEYAIRSECLWTCSAFKVDPPPELVKMSKAHSLDRDDLLGRETTGFFSEDPVDLVNSIICLPTDLTSVKKLTEEYEALVAAQASAAAEKARQQQMGIGQQPQQQHQLGELGMMSSSVAGGSAAAAALAAGCDDVQSMLSEDNVKFTYPGDDGGNELFATLKNGVPLKPFVATMSHLVPSVDINIFASCLGRPDGTMELTAHRLCQVVSLWRRTALAIIAAAFEPASSEDPDARERITAHAAQMSGKKKSNVSSISPFEAVSSHLDWITSIVGLPISVMQSLQLLSRGGSVDPWLEDPRATGRAGRFQYELTEMMDMYQSDIPRAMSHNEPVRLTLPPQAFEALQKIDMNATGSSPVELLRTFLERSDLEVTNAQMTAIFWSLCRVNEEPEPGLGGIQGTIGSIEQGGGADAGGSIENSQSAAANSSKLDTFQTGGFYRPVVQTVFNGDPEGYMRRFGEDVDKYLESMPTIDVNVVLGYLPVPLIPSSAHELVSDAMKLDVSSRNPMPSTCCVWLGERNMQLEDQLRAVTLNPMQLAGMDRATIEEVERAEDAERVAAKKETLADIKPPTAEESAAAASAAASVAGGESVGSAPVPVATVESKHNESKHQEQGNNSYKDGRVIGVGTRSFHGRRCRDSVLADTRTHVELDMLAKYPEMCEIKASDRHYGPAGNEPILLNKHTADDHWNILTNRRLQRLDKLTLSWRDTSLNEWANSLYSSRQQRFVNRVSVVKNCVSVYHKQYKTLRESIVNERSALLARFNGIETELRAMIQENYNFFSNNSSFLERTMRRYEGQIERMILLIADMMSTFQRHCGSIKRRAFARVNAASDRLREELETSCNGLIVGYTAGYAQGYFDELLFRGEMWRKTLTEVQGQLIIEKERFVTTKDDLDRDLTVAVTDKITLDRNRTKHHMDNLANDTAQMLDLVATTRASYASLQKDANARLVLRIEKAIRESRRLRAAAEQQAEVEEAALRDIRVVLHTARTSCEAMVNQIKLACTKQLRTVDPHRKPHRLKMERRVAELKGGWGDLEMVLLPLIEDYEKEVFKHLSLTKLKCVEITGQYHDKETKQLVNKHKSERKGLISSFRQHFRDYDLSEAAIFERFNREVLDTVAEMNVLWGPSRPKFIVHALGELEEISHGAISAAEADVIASTRSDPQINDDIALGRMELVDYLCHSLNKCYDYALKVPAQFIREKKNQLVEIDEMSMEKNGDMVRPQVRAVMDLLLSGIEIDSDFAAGYDALVTSTVAKSQECSEMLVDFVDRYSDASKPLSIGYSAALTVNRITRRKEEVTALIEASEAHLIADDSRLDVLIAAGDKDIEEWASLTMQLVDNAFKNAEQSYLSNLWPTPPPTPRLELVPEEEDRVGKLKALLNATQEENDNKRVMSRQRLEEEEEEERQARRERKERRREERSRKKSSASSKNDTPPKEKLESDQTRELQQGWFECVSSDGFTYFFNPETDESLWQLPAALRIPKVQEEDEQQSQQLMDTPRALLQLEPAYAEEQTVPYRIVDNEFSLALQPERDPKVIMSSVAEEARAAVALAMDTAFDVTNVIHGKRGTDESTIANLLGDKFDPTALRKSAKKLDPSRPGEHGKRRGGERADDDEEVSVDSVAQINKYGRIISDHSSQIDQGEMANMLLDLGLGGGGDDDNNQYSEEEVRAVVALIRPPPGYEESDAIKDAMLSGSPEVLNEADMQRWKQLGLGSSDAGKRGEQEYESSDDDTHDVKKKKRQTRQYLAKLEIDQMLHEEELSIRYENIIEDANCQAFQAEFSRILQANTAYDEDLIKLQKMAYVLRPVNVNDIMIGLHASWGKIEDIIKDTKMREIAQAELAARLRTEEGLWRQRIILDHAEDINELAEFMHSAASFSKTLSRRCATDAMIKNISTPKKLAKLWSREQVNLGQDFQLDEDDVEELENALRRVLLEASNSQADLMNQSFNSLSRMNMLQNQNGGFASPLASFVGSNNQLIPVVPPVSQHQQQQQQQSLPKTYSSQYLDPSYVKEVVEEGEEEEEDPEENVHGDRRSIGSRGSNVSSIRHKAVASSKTLVHKYQLSADGYKSFRGGWIEGVNDSGQVYYYNTKTGQSLWNLPVEIGDEEADEAVWDGVVDVHDNANDNADGGGVDATSTSVTETVHNYDDQSIEARSLVLVAAATDGSGSIGSGGNNGGGGGVNGGGRGGELVDTRHTPRDRPPHHQNPPPPYGQPVPGDATAVVANEPWFDGGAKDAYLPSSNFAGHIDQLQQQQQQPSIEENNYSNHQQQEFPQEYDQQAYGDDYYDGHDQQAAAAHQDGNNPYDEQYAYPADGGNHSATSYDENPFQHQQQQIGDYQGGSIGGYEGGGDGSQSQKDGYYYYDDNNSNSNSNNNYYISDGGSATQAAYFDGDYYAGHVEGDAYYYPTEGQDAVLTEEVLPGANPHFRAAGAAAAAAAATGGGRGAGTAGAGAAAGPSALVSMANYEPPAKPRTLPVPQKLEVASYSKKEGVNRQQVLLNSQDRWQNALVKAQQAITAEKSTYLKKREEMYEKVTARVESRLAAFVEKIKFMQKSIKKDLGESNSTERDLRRLFEDKGGAGVLAEKLSFLLESLEKFKVTCHNRYDSAFAQFDQFSSEWAMIRAELEQVCTIFDEGVASNLEQCKLACEHITKLFAYDQMKLTGDTRKIQIRKLRNALHRQLRSDTHEAAQVRARGRIQELAQYRQREIKMEEIRRKWDFDPLYDSQKALDDEVTKAGFPPLSAAAEIVPEEEAVMSYMLTQVEMETSLRADYDSITEATKLLAADLYAGISLFDDKEMTALHEDGSWCNKHRETIERHEAALNVTLTKVKNKVNEGYQLLNSKIESLDFDVERAAEEELVDDHHQQVQQQKKKTGGK